MLDDDKVAWDMVERCVSKELREDQTLLIENVVDWYDHKNHVCLNMFVVVSLCPAH